MTDIPKHSQRNVTPNLIRFVLLALMIIASPSMAHADDLFIKNGLESVATSIGFLAAAIAFAGIVFAIALFLTLGSRRPE